MVAAFASLVFSRIYLSWGRPGAIECGRWYLKIFHTFHRLRHFALVVDPPRDEKQLNPELLLPLKRVEKAVLRMLVDKIDKEDELFPR